MQTTAPPPPASPPHDLAREIWQALAIVFGGTLILAIVQWILPFTADFMQVGLALLLLEVPLRLVSNPREAGLYLGLGSFKRGLRLGLLAILLVFPLFVGGFHLVYSELLERPSRWEVSRLARFSEDLEYAPPSACGRTEVSVWTQESQLWIAAPAAARLELRLVTDTPPVARQLRCGSLPTVGRALRPDPDGVWRPPVGVGAFFDLGTSSAFELHLSDQRGPIPEDLLRLGARSVTASDDGLVEGSRSYLWLLAYLLIHLGLVAYPEEYFFRGYLLPRLDQRFGTPRRILGVAVGPGLLLSALAFALLHPILIPGAHRLLVFFPALLFGWLAARQRELGAAIVVHAGSNVLLAIVSRMYG